MKIAVIMPVLNQFKMAIDALANLHTKHDWQPFIIPNYRAEMSVAESWNFGIKLALDKKVDYILVINDDILIAPWTVDRLVEFMEAKDSDTVMATALDIRGDVHPADFLSMHRQSTDVISEAPNFSCFMINSDTIDKIGWFDESFKPAYFEDNDYCRRIIVNGYKAVAVHDAPFYHYGSQSQNYDPNNVVVSSTAFNLNRNYYRAKWGGEPGDEQYTTPFNRK